MERNLLIICSYLEDIKKGKLGNGQRDILKEKMKVHLKTYLIDLRKLNRTPFTLAQVDTKDILDKKTLGRKIWNHICKNGLPRYQCI